MQRPASTPRVGAPARRRAAGGAGRGGGGGGGGGGGEGRGRPGEGGKDDDRYGAALGGADQCRDPLARRRIGHRRPAELEDGRVGSARCRFSRFTHGLTPGRPSRAGPAPPRARHWTTSIVGNRSEERSIAARYAPAFEWPASAGHRAGAGQNIRIVGSCQGRCVSAKAGSARRPLSSGMRSPPNVAVSAELGWG